MKNQASARVFIDCDVIIDWLTNRKPFATYAKMLIKNAEEGDIRLVTSPLVIANVSYILRRLKGKQATRAFLESLLGLVEVCDLKAQDVIQAVQVKDGDLEDEIHQQTALRVDVEAIITRNKKDYGSADITVLTPREFALSKK